MTTMRALRARSRGGPEALTLEVTAIPVPGAGEVLVQVHAAAITYAELGWDLSWTTSTGEDRTPITPSHEFSGVVADVGADVPSARIGEPVFGLVPFDRNGAAADFVVVPDTHVAQKPRTLSHVAAASLPLAALTAWQSLVDHAAVMAGEKVLVLGGAGGVGSLAVQLAVCLGADVTATALPEDMQFVRDLGAPRVIPSGVIGRSDDGERWDVVIDTVGREADGVFSAVQPGTGRLITLQSPPSQDQARDHHVTATFFIVGADRAELQQIADLADRGQLRPIIAGVFTLEDGRRAFESGLSPTRPPGKVVLAVR
jgi:NADPH:quinone reductase-like Zn-dependent oxidoreductase